MTYIHICFKIQDAQCEEELDAIISKDDLQLMLTQAGFTCELVNMTNRHRACQCIIVHVVFKTRREELQQMRNGLESVSIMQFLQISGKCVKYVFPLQNEVKIELSDILQKINGNWLKTLDSFHAKIMEWFAQYLKEIDQRNSGTVTFN